MLGKCRSGSNWREGSAVSAPSASSLGAASINSVTHGNANKDWSEYDARVSKRWNIIGYYYTGDYVETSDPSSYATQTNADAVVTYTAVPNGRHSIEGVSWSYSGTPTGTLMVEDGSGNVIFSEDITVAGPGFFNFGNLVGSINTDMIITLVAGGSGVVGKLNVLGHKIT